MDYNDATSSLNSKDISRGAKAPNLSTQYKMSL